MTQKTTTIRVLLIDPSTGVVRSVNTEPTLEGIGSTIGSKTVHCQAVLTLGEPALVFSNRKINATPRKPGRVSVLPGMAPLAGRLIISGVADAFGNPSSFDTEPADVAPLISFADGSQCA